MQSMEMSRAKKDFSTFCVMPFSHLFANEIGDMYLCCMAVESEEPVRDSAGRAFSFKNPELIGEAWNSESMKKTRLDLLSGQKPKACERCFKFEDNQIGSLRQAMNDRYSALQNQMIEATAADGSMEFNPLSVDIRLGNKCNLRCRMCSPQASKALIDDWRHVYPEIGEDFLTTLKNIDWFSNPQYWATLLRHLDSIQNFHFAGGEPFLIKEMFQFLQKIIESGRASDISITYNTNVTILPKEIFQLWPHFKSVALTLSLDGTEKINNYIRYPADWKKIISNMKTLDEMAPQLKISHMQINTTVQAYNILDLPEFLDQMIPQFKNVHFPLMSLLFNPNHLSVSVLPPTLRDLAHDRLEAWLSDSVELIRANYREWDEITQLQTSLDGLLKFLKMDHPGEGWERFKNVTRRFDQVRGQNLSEIVPEFRPFLEGQV